MLKGELLQSYLVPNAVWDEMVDSTAVREQYGKVMQFLNQLSIDELNKKEELAKRLFMSQGHHLHSIQQRRRHRKNISLRHHSTYHHCSRMGLY